MTMLANPSGWAKRRQKARKRHMKDPMDRAAIRAARAAFYAGEAPVAEAVEQVPEPVAPLQAAYAESRAAESAEVFSLDGNWMQTRARVRDALALDKVPGSKAEAAELLTAAGFTVEGFDGSA